MKIYGLWEHGEGGLYLFGLFATESLAQTEGERVLENWNMTVGDDHHWKQSKRFADWKCSSLYDRLVIKPHVVHAECGPDNHDMYCACGCGGDDSRCDTWLAHDKLQIAVPEWHTCCK